MPSLVSWTARLMPRPSDAAEVMASAVPIPSVMAPSSRQDSSILADAVRHGHRPGGIRERLQGLACLGEASGGEVGRRAGFEFDSLVAVQALADDLRLPKGRFLDTIEPETRHDAPVPSEPLVELRHQICEEFDRFRRRMHPPVKDQRRHV